jgi:hypothetical protein
MDSVRWLARFWGLCFVLLVPLAACFKRSAPVVFGAMVLASLLLARDLDLKGTIRRFFQAGHSRKALGVGLLLFWGWCGLSLLWALSPRAGFALWMKISGVMAGGVILFAAMPRVAPLIPSRLWLGLWVTGTGFFGVELLENNPVRTLFRHNPDVLQSTHALLAEYINSGLTFSLLFWAVLVSVLGRGRRVQALGLALATILVLRHIDTDAARLGWFLGVGVWGVCQIFPLRWVRLGCAALLLVGVLQAPLAGLALSVPRLAAKAEAALPGHRARMIIWEYTARIIAQKPLRGWGLGATTPAARKIAQVDFYGLLPSPLPAPAFLAPADPGLPLDPHNAFLHIHAELGMVGALLWAAVMILLIRVGDGALPDEDKARPAWSAFWPVWYGYATAVLLILGVNCSVWHTWLLSALVLGALALACVHRRRAFEAEQARKARVFQALLKQT